MSATMVPASPAQAAGKGPRVNKGVLSQSIHSRCELALYLSLFREADIKARGLPVPIQARSGVHLIRNAGIGFEADVYAALVAAVPEAILARAVPGADGRPEYKERELGEYLAEPALAGRAILQSCFSLGAHPVDVLVRLGAGPERAAAFPELGRFVPDIVFVRPSAPGDVELMADGGRAPVPAGDDRLMLVVTDAKHADQPNPSYEAEAVLYALLLANYLVRERLDGRYAVSAAPRLWTRGGGGLDALAGSGGTAAERLAAIEAALEPVNVSVHVQEIRRFVASRVPDVLARGDADWRALDWHVSPTCNTCDWLGHVEWLDEEHRKLVRGNPGHYCMTRADDGDHLCRVPGLARGPARALRGRGVATAGDLIELEPDDEAFDGHTRLAAARRTLPLVAGSIAEGAKEDDPERVDALLPPSSSLTVAIGVDYDGGAGLLTGLAVNSAFFPASPPLKGKERPEPKAREPIQPKDHPAWVSQAWVVERKDPASERAAVLAFLREMGRLMRFATDTDPARGGPHAERATGVVLFWSRNHYDVLCAAVGRHLPAVAGSGDAALCALAWLFPGDSLQRSAYGSEGENAVVILRDVMGRLVRTGSPYAVTLAEAVKSYRTGNAEPILPHPFYAEPLTDSIPRERIYEIWEMVDGATKTLNVYPRDDKGNPLPGRPRTEKAFTRDDFVGMYARALRTQALGIATIARNIRRDFKGRLLARAPRLRLAPPDWMDGVAIDAKLWVARAEFEAAHARRERVLAYMSDFDEVEARFEGIRLVRRLGDEPGGGVAYAVGRNSRDAKLKAGEVATLVLDEPGFAMRRLKDVLGDRLPDGLKGIASRRMHEVMAFELAALDRAGLRAVLRPAERKGKQSEALDAARDLVADDLFRGRGELMLMSTMPSAVTPRRLAAVMREVGDPAIALPSPAALAALGIPGGRAPGTSPLSPIARVLWDSPALSAASAMDPARVEAALAAALASARLAGGLDASQAAAVRAALERCLTLVWGPPGTGKTNTLRALLHGIVREAADAGRPARILVTGPTYKAVGEVAARLARTLGLDPAARCRLALLGPADRPMDAEDPKAAHVGFARVEADPESEAFADLLDALSGDGVVVVFAVTHQCARLSEKASAVEGGGKRMLRPLFDTVVLDEASQVDMATAAFPLALMRPGARLVVAGDHLQMPPVQAVEPPAGAESLVGSLLTYLKDRFGVEPVPLLVNYRSNADIVAYCRGLGYPQGLRAHNAGYRLRLLPAEGGADADALGAAAGLPGCGGFDDALAADRPLVALTYPDGISGQANPFEAGLVAALVLRLRLTASRALDGAAGDPAHAHWDDAGFFTRGVGVVTPHRAQRARVVAAILKAMPHVDPALVEGCVDTVERFQGGERHTVIISFGVGDPDTIQGEERFLLGLERTNVAISRAQAKCVTLLSEELAGHIPVDRIASRAAHALRGLVDEWPRERRSHAVAHPGGPGRLTAHWR